jgi:hypothetical protein
VNDQPPRWPPRPGDRVRLRADGRLLQIEGTSARYGETLYWVAVPDPHTFTRSWPQRSGGPVELGFWLSELAPLLTEPVEQAALEQALATR